MRRIGQVLYCVPKTTYYKFQLYVINDMLLDIRTYVWLSTEFCWLVELTSLMHMHQHSPIILYLRMCFDMQSYWLVSLAE